MATTTTTPLSSSRPKPGRVFLSRESSKLKWHADAEADARWCCDSQTVLALKPSSTKGYRVQEGMGKCVVERFSNFHQAKPDSALSLQGSG